MRGPLRMRSISLVPRTRSTLARLNSPTAAPLSHPHDYSALSRRCTIPGQNFTDTLHDLDFEGAPFALAWFERLVAVKRTYDPTARIPVFDHGRCFLRCIHDELLCGRVLAVEFSA